MSAEPKFKEAEEKLIGIAVLFIGNPNVEKESEELKKAFLKKKGLNEKMIREAFHRYEIKKAEQEKKDSSQDSASGQRKVDIDALISKSYRTKFLSLRNADLKELSSELISKIGHIEQLILNNNQFTSIDPSIKSLKNLRTFHLVNCGLDVGILPIEFFELEGLEELNLSSNHIHSLSEFLKLPNLQRLDLSKNDIIEVNPKMLNENRSLNVVNLKENNITALPEGIRKSLVIII
jgi:hypothetical protein